MLGPLLVFFLSIGFVSLRLGPALNPSPSTLSEARPGRFELPTNGLEIHTLSMRHRVPYCA